jgi:thioredoxin-dependent peroxiredoxin
MLAAGAKAPEFTARTTTGTQLALGELRGRWVVLYFFPKAFTAG